MQLDCNSSEEPAAVHQSNVPSYKLVVMKNNVIARGEIAE